MFADYFFYKMVLALAFAGLMVLVVLVWFCLPRIMISRGYASDGLMGFGVVFAVTVGVTLASIFLIYDLRSDGVSEELTMITETVSNRKIVSVNADFVQNEYSNEAVDVNEITYIDESNEETTMQLFFTQAWMLPSDDDSYHIAISGDEKLTIYKPTVMISE